jgi:photosystem II stability/assembly factor-like uncharacterized protein
MRRAGIALAAGVPLALGALALSCNGPLEFVCTSNANCTRGGVTGQCRVSPAGPSYCALPDAMMCGGGLRWDDTAGAGLAGTCVGGSIGDGGTGGDMAVPPALTFKLANSGTQGDLYNLSGWAPSMDLWVVGPAGVFKLKSDGSFADVTPNPGDAGGGFSVYEFAAAPVGPGEVFVSTDSGITFHTSDGGTTWQIQNLPTTLPQASMWGFSPTEVYSVGRGDTILHTTNGIGWDLSATSSGQDLNAIWASSRNDIFIAGTGGTIYHSSNDGSTWALQSTGTTTDLFGLWGSGPSDVFAVGDAQVVLHYDGSSWTQVRGPQPQAGMQFPAFFSVWASGPNDVWTCGIDNMLGGVIYHSSDGGQTWEQNSYKGGQVNALWGFSSALVYAVGPGGLILKGM